MKYREKLVSVFLAVFMATALLVGVAIATGSGLVYKQVNGRVVALFEGGVGIDPTATGDPNMTVVNNQFTTILGSAQAVASVDLVPADANYIPTYFDSAPNAAAVSYELFGEDSIDTGKVSVSIVPMPITGGYAAHAIITLPSDGSAGAISVKFTNPNSTPAGAYVNVTVVRDSATATTPDNVAQRLYKPDGLGTYYDIMGMVVPKNEFYELPSATLNAATGMDVLFYSWDKNTNPTPLPNLSDVVTYYTAGFGNYVYAMEIDGTVYAASGNDGWMYGAYRQVGTTTSLDLVEVSPYVGADAYIASSRDLMIWRYGDLGSYDSLFPGQITFP